MAFSLFHFPLFTVWILESCCNFTNFSPCSCCNCTLFQNSGFLNKCISMSQPDPATRWRYISATLTKIHCSVKKNTDNNGLEMRPLRTWQAMNSGSRWSLSTYFKDMQAIWRDFFRFTRFSDEFCWTKKKCRAHCLFTAWSTKTNLLCTFKSNIWKFWSNM